MARKKSRFALLIRRLAEARQIVADQQKLIAELKAAKQSILDAEGTLQMYLSSLKHLEENERRTREEVEAKKGETKKPGPRYERFAPREQQ